MESARDNDKVRKVISMKKLQYLLWICCVVFAYCEANACTDPSKKASVKVADDDCLVYEYFQPAKASAKKRAERPITEIADSLLSVAKESFEQVNNGVTNSTYEHMSVDAVNELGDYRPKANAAVYRTKIWADSICNLFRRGTYKSQYLDSLPR
jgi:hypothetical protein